MPNAAGLIAPATATATPAPRAPSVMLRLPSSPPDASSTSTPAPATYGSPPPPNRRKRKHSAISDAIARNTSSPAPSDPGFSGTQAEAQEEGSSSGAVVANASASALRPRLTVSRGPVFVPVSEGSIYHTTDQIAINRLNFRYFPAGLAEPGSILQFRTIESKPPGCVRVSWEDRSSFVKVTTDGLGLCGAKGYRSARLNVPVREGRWYMEVKFEHGDGAKPPESTPRQGAHIRLGWGRREAGLNCPVGLDGYSYGYMDKNGHKVTLSRPRPYGRPYGPGDVIGMYISLPPKCNADENDPYDPAHIKRERIAIDFRGQEYFETLEYPQSKEMMALMDSAANKLKPTSSVPSSSKKSATVKSVPERSRSNKPIQEPTPSRPLPILRGSHIAFFVNGECQNIAFQDLYDYLQLRTIPSARKDRNRRRTREGVVEHTENPFDDGWLGYYPFISLFNGARVHVNSGPNFEYPPPADIDGVLSGDPDSADTKTRTWRPLCERYAEFMNEQWALDAQEEIEARVKAESAKNGNESEKKANETVTTKPPARPKPPQSRPRPQMDRAKVHDNHLKSDVPSRLGVDSNASSAPSPTPGLPSVVVQSPAVSQPLPGYVEEQQMTEAERKVKERRERKRMLERARRARQREEKLRLKKLEEEQRLSAAIATSTSNSPLPEAGLIMPTVMNDCPSNSSIVESSKNHAELPADQGFQAAVDE